MANCGRSLADITLRRLTSITAPSPSPREPPTTTATRFLPQQACRFCNSPDFSIAADFNTASYDVRNDSKADHSYQAINYTVTVTNTGNKTLTGLQTADGHSLDHLDVGQSWTYTSMYHVTQSDIDSGGVAPRQCRPLRASQTRSR